MTTGTLDAGTVAVLAGGLGTRMSGVLGASVPKVMIPVDGRPFLEFKLASLAVQGVRHVVLLLGHGADRVVEHLEVTGCAGRFGVDVSVVTDGPRLLGTGGAVRRALPRLGDGFWVTYGDTYLDVPMRDVELRLARHPGAWDGVMTVLHNRDRWDRSNVRLAGDVVAEYRKGAPPRSFEHIDYGLLLLSRTAFEAWPDREAFDLADVVIRLVGLGRLGAYEVTERFHEVGTPDAWEETDRVLRERGEWQRLCRALAAGDPAGRPPGHGGGDA